jgi:hypothetical protein
VVVADAVEPVAGEPSDGSDHGDEQSLSWPVAAPANPASTRSTPAILSASEPISHATRAIRMADCDGGGDVGHPGSPPHEA